MQTPTSPSQAQAIEHFKYSSVFIYVLVGLLAVQPMTTDFYLPSLPSISKAFGVSTSLVTWTLSAQVGTFGVTQLFTGPLADRFGRRPVALVGLIIYLLASIGAIFAPFIEMLIACRSLQGLGVACAYVCSRAMVRDLCEPAEGARLLARGLMLMAIAPILGPTIGGLLDTTLGWQGPFMALAAFSGVVLLLVWRSMPETNTKRNPHAADLAPLVRNYLTILRHPVFLSHTTVSALSYGAIFTFLSGSSFVFINIFGLSRTMYGIAFGCTGIGYLSGTKLSRHFITRYGMTGTITRAALLSISGGLALMCLQLLHINHPVILLAACIIIFFAHGMQQPCTQASSIAPFPHMAGAASALNGFAQMSVAVVVGAWIGRHFDGTSWPLSVTMFTMSALVMCAGLILVRRYGHVQ